MEISKEELSALIEGAVSKVLKTHHCTFSPEEKQILKDIATGGKAFKKIIIYLVVGFLLVGIGVQNLPSILKIVKG